MRLNSGTLIFIVVLLVVIVGAVFLLNNDAVPTVQPTSQPTVETVQLFPGASALNVTAVTIISRRDPAEVPVEPAPESTAEATAEATPEPEATDEAGLVQVTLTIEKDEAGIWQLGSTSSIESTRSLVQPTIESTLPTLVALRSADQFQPEGGNLAPFGLDNPTHEIRFAINTAPPAAAESTPEADAAASTQTFRLRIGNKNPQQTGYYALLGDDESTVYLVSNAAGIDNILNWTTQPPFAVPPTPTPAPVLNLPGPIFTSFQAQTLTRFTATNNETGETVAFSRPVETGNWIIEESSVDVAGLTPDVTLITVAIADYATLTATSGANVEDLSTLGLDNPAYTFVGETTTGENYTLRVGDADPTGQRYYALVNDFETVVELPKATIDNLINLIANPPVIEEATPEVTAESTAAASEATPEATDDSAAVPEATEEPAEATEVMEATEEPAEATEVMEMTEEPAEATEVMEATEEPAEATEVMEATEEPAEATEVMEATEEPAEATEVMEATEEPAEATEVMEATEEPAEATEVMEATEEPVEMNTVVDVVVGQENLSTLTMAVVAAGLVEPLAEGEFVVFAPDDDAFAVALEELDISADDLLADTDTLTSILTYHVVSLETFEDALAALSEEDTESVEVETVNGETVALAVDEDGNFTINGVAFADALEADNGAVYLIDEVLLPTLEESAEMTPEATEAAQ